MKKIFSIIIVVALISSCKKVLDIVPDNIATIDYAFRLRDEAEKYLYTCYSYLPKEGSYDNNPALGAGDEYWMSPQFTNVNQLPRYVFQGYQTAENPLMSNWDDMYRAIRDCNIFLDNIDKVVDIQPVEKARWVGEVKFLKAYYHWYLFRMYGPIPLVDKNMPVGAPAEDLKLSRQPADSVVNLIVRLLDEATVGLPATIKDTKNELGRITKPAVMAIKARVLVTAASPFFNGNTDYATVKNNDGTVLINQTYSGDKWKRAATACKEAIESCIEAGLQLYQYNDPYMPLSTTLATQMSVRNSFNQRWNPELIWGLTNSLVDYGLQSMAMPRLDPDKLGNESTMGQLAPTMKMAELFYTENGVPINEDKDWDYANRYSLRTATEDEGDLIEKDYTTVGLHFNRESRFYADIAFDGAVWLMRNGTWHIEAKYGQNQAQKNKDKYSMTGYFNKKIVNWEYVIKDDGGSSVRDYPWPAMRLADLYLLYAEASNEADGPNDEAYTYINKVRARAGLPTVQVAWTEHSTKPGKFSSKDGFREIIQQERLIEMAFEGSRFWDLRRWKRGLDEMNKPLMGWDINEEKTEGYYLPKTLFTPVFQLKDYLWPIKNSDIIVNKNLVQNLGWK